MKRTNSYFYDNLGDPDLDDWEEDEDQEPEELNDHIGI